MTKFLTGFSFLGRHLHMVDDNLTKYCRACEDDNIEDSIHLTYCDALLNISRQILTTYHEDHTMWDVPSMLEFISHNKVAKLLHGQRLGVQ
jgi:hypothetical protein